jgi:peptide/nickel transport system substrate-binding protein
MRNLRWQALIAILSLLLVAGLLAGQGRTGTIIVEPTQGGIYTEAMAGSPHWLNPLLDLGGTNPVERDLDRLIFSGLTRFDSMGRPAPELAHWTVSADQLTYQFILKPNLKWQDGEPLTTDDVAFTLGLLQDPAFPGPADVGKLWQSVHVTVVSPQIIELALPEPFAPFLDYTTVGLLPKHLLPGVTAATLSQQAFNQKPVGSGPFAFGHWLRSEGTSRGGVVLNSFAGYYGPAPKLNQIQFTFYPDAAAAFAAYQQGKALGLSRIEEPQLAEALRRPELGIYTSQLPEYSLIFLNLRGNDLPFFQDKRVRLAMLQALNRQAMVTDLLQGQAIVANSPVLPGSWAFNPNLPVRDYAPDAAANALTNAGWVLPEGAVAGTPSYVRQKDTVPFQFTLIAANDTTHLAVAHSAQATWAAVGISVTVTAVDPASLQSQYLVPHAFQAVLADLNLSGTPDPDPYPLWHETQVESGQNYGGFADRLTSEYLEQARITLDLETRARRYQAFQSRFADEVPALLLYYPVYNYGVDTKVMGVQIGLLTEPSDRFNNIADWYIATKKVNSSSPGSVPGTPTVAK